MRVLLVYPRFPRTFWSYDAVLALVGRKALLPPLGLITVAALLPGEWECRLVDRNVREVTDEEWAWADLVAFSAMIVQQEDVLCQIQEAKRRGKIVAVGGPYPTALPRDLEAAGADFLVLDEAELTVPLFVDAWVRGDRRGIIRAGGRRPDLTMTPVPRFDLLDLDAYDSMSVQFSRGCPFQCEFCDIITLYGRTPRTKPPAHLLKELDCLYELGWRRSVFVVDDNFIGHRRHAKLLLRALKAWQEAHGYPFSFDAEASVDLADDPELLDLMAACGFGGVFVGIETADDASLRSTGKLQNTRRPLAESVDAIVRAGLRVMAGFIIGFDGEAKGAGDRIVRFLEDTSIPAATLSMLQALPETALWQRLEREGRLRAGTRAATLNQTAMMNFVPTRPLVDVAQEYVEAFWRLYDPMAYLDRAYRHFLRMGPPRGRPSLAWPGWTDLKALAIVCWRQGVRRRTRWRFWHHLLGILRHNRAVVDHYVIVCAHYEHFIEYRETVREQIEAQLRDLYPEEPAVFHGESGPLRVRPEHRARTQRAWGRPRTSRSGSSAANARRAGTPSRVPSDE